MENSSSKLFILQDHTYLLHLTANLVINYSNIINYRQGMKAT